MKITAVLITKERVYPQEILDSLPTFDEILIRTECPSVLARYELAKQAKNDVIYIQDDDVIADFPRLLENYNGQITNAMTPNHFEWYKGTGITLIGWGTLFPKVMVDFTKYLDKYPIDELLLSQADRVFTYLNQPHNSIIMDINHLPTASAAGRMSTSAGHWDKLANIRQRLENL